VNACCKIGFGKGVEKSKVFIASVATVTFTQVIDPDHNREVAKNPTFEKAGSTNDSESIGGLLLAWRSPMGWI
jgi:hypothetical protein